MNSKYAEGMSYKYATLLFYIDSIQIHVLHRMIPVKGYIYMKSLLYINGPHIAMTFRVNCQDGLVHRTVYWIDRYLLAVELKYELSR